LKTRNTAENGGRSPPQAAVRQREGGSRSGRGRQAGTTDIQISHASLRVVLAAYAPSQVLSTRPSSSRSALHSPGLVPGVPRQQHASTAAQISGKQHFCVHRAGASSIVPALCSIAIGACPYDCSWMHLYCGVAAAFQSCLCARNA
jgi:hypothetical protein